MAGSELKIDILSPAAQAPLLLETNPPFLENQNPAPAEPGVEIERDISFRVRDALDEPTSGVDSSSLSVWVKQGAGTFVLAISGGVFQAGFSGTVTEAIAPATAYDVVINPDAFLADGSTIQVRVVVNDTTVLANQLDTTYSFDTEPGETNAPFISNENPARGATGIFSGVPIQFRITDAADQVDSGVDISTLRVQVEDGLGNGYVDAVLNGVFVNGYTGLLTDLGGGLSYDVTVVPPANWNQLDRVSIIVDVDDTKA